MRIVWLPRAIKHLDEIYEWHLDKSIRVATKLYNDVLDFFKNLSFVSIQEL
jgi:hypothetical protein